MTEHTPGPWIVNGYTVVSGKSHDVTLIANINHSHDPLHGPVPGDRAFNAEMQANARLIAAAPEMLIELKSLRKRFRRALELSGTMGEFADEAVAAADRLIAKATGQ